MATFSVGYNFVIWTGPVTLLKTAPWIGNVTAVYDISVTRKAFIGFKATAAFPAVTQLAPATPGALPRVYMLDVKTAFTLDDALVGLVVQVPNVLPVASAGADLTITLPTSAAQLTGSGSDTDGVIATYGWAQVTGPQQAVIAAPTMPTTLVSGLVAGVYLFDLTVTDNKGGANTDRVMVTVNPAPQPVIASFTPGTGPVGAQCTVTGNGFGSTQNGSTIAVNGVPVTSFISWSNTSVTFAIPAGASTGKLSLTTAGGTATSSTDFTIQAAALPILLVFDGNSGLANASNGSNPGDFTGSDVPAQVVASLTQQGYSLVARNYAVGGQTTTQMLSDVVAQIDPLATSAQYSRHIIVVCEWANDVTLGNVPLDLAYQNYVHYCRDRQAAGFEVVVGNEVPRASYLGNMTAESYAAARSEVNLLLKNNWRGYADNLADFSQLALNQPDGTHPDAAGYALIAQQLTARVKEVIDHTVPAQTLPLPPAGYGAFSGNGSFIHFPTNPSYKSVAFYIRADSEALFGYGAAAKKGLFIADYSADFSQVSIINVDIPINGVQGWADGVKLPQDQANCQVFGKSNWVTGYFEGYTQFGNLNMLGSSIAFNGDYLSLTAELAQVVFYNRLWTPAEISNSAQGILPSDFVAQFDLQNAVGSSVPDSKGGAPATLGNPLPTIH